MRLHHLALLASAALLGCSVETASLKPKTDAECVATDPNTKACGFKCVRTDDPATGCGTPGVCTPCSGGDPGHHMVSTCSAGACVDLCEYGWGDCNVDRTDGCEHRIDANDTSNCGACGRSCTSCIAGACSGTEQGAFVTPRGLVRSEGGAIYVADPGLEGGAIADEYATVIATMLGSTRWLAVVPGQNRLIATGTAPSGTSPYGFSFTIDEITDPGPFATVNTLVVADPTVAGDHLEGIASAGATIEYFFTRAGSDQVWAWDTSASRTYSAVPTSVKPKGLVSYGGKVYFGSSTNGGEAWWVEPTGTSYVRNEVVGRAGRPTHAAVFAEPGFSSGQPLLFWISGDDGSVHATLASGTSAVVELFAADPSHALDGDVDMVADADGVYWVDGSSGLVAMWRAADDRVIPVGFSSSPFAIAVTSYWIYWTDAATNKLYYTEKPFVARPAP